MAISILHFNITHLDMEFDRLIQAGVLLSVQGLEVTCSSCYRPNGKEYMVYSADLHFTVIF